MICEMEVGDAGKQSASDLIADGGFGIIHPRGKKWTLTLYQKMLIPLMTKQTLIRI